MIVPLYKSKGERNDCKNYRDISLLSVVGKIYAGILIDRVRRVTGGLIDDEQGVFREGRGCVVQIFILKLFNVYMDTVMKEVKMGIGNWGVRLMEEGREWRLPLVRR